jgi:hypothetical protein
MISMIDTRAKRQELQDQILAAARKGQQRVNSTVKNVTATAQMIRPQLPGMPPRNLIKLPSAEQFAQLRDKQLSQLREKAPGLIARLPNSEHLRAGANEVADQVRTVRRQVADAQRQVADVQRQVVGQVRAVAGPLAHQAAAAIAQATSAMQKNGRIPAVTQNGAAAGDTAKAPSAKAPSAKAPSAKGHAAKAPSAKGHAAKIQSAKSGTAKTSSRVSAAKKAKPDSK